MLKALVLVLLVSLARGEICPNRSALNKVDAWVQYDLKQDGTLYGNYSFYNLDKFVTIELLKANVTVLCEGMIQRFIALERFSLVDANLVQIQPNAFQKLPNLTHLSLAVNNLTHIKRYHFGTIPSLETLYLSANQIEYIDDDAFDDLGRLKKIYLDRNRLYEINQEWFAKTPQISLIELSFNFVSKLQKEAFILGPNSNVKIRLQHNIIEVIEPGAVAPRGANDEEIPYLILHLENNKLETVSASFIESMDKMQSNIVLNSNRIKCISNDTLIVLRRAAVSLHVVQNPIDCDCMKTIGQFVDDYPPRASLYYNTTLECLFHDLKAPNWYYN